MKISVTYPPHTKIWFHDIARAVTDSFQNCNTDVKLIPTYNINELESDLVFVLAPHGYYEKSSNFVLKKKRHTQYVCWDLEQTPLDGQVSDISINHFERALKYFYFYDYFFTESEGKTRFWLKQGFDVDTLDIGYHPVFTYPTVKTGSTYDVFFTGSIFPRRSKILNSLKESGLIVYPGNFCLFNPRERAQAIYNSKVCLNVHHNELQYFEKTRIITEIMANKGFCITEEIRYPDDFEDKKQFIMVPYEKLSDTVVKYIKGDQSIRDKIATQAWNYITTNLLMEDKIRKFLFKIKRRIK
jgi:hypothetical protein